MASSLRNLGQAEESVALLTAELDAGSDDPDSVFHLNQTVVPSG